MFYLDLEELAILPDRLWFMSYNRFNIFNFKDSDHLPLSPLSLKENCKTYLKQNGVSFEKGRIYLLTHLRTFGYIFNPVSFYFCFDERDAPLCAIAEVSNTFGEMKPFFISKDRLQQGQTFYQITKKHFYVSPFMDLDIDFEFKLRVPDQTLELHINDLANNKTILLASFTGKKIELNNLNLLKCVLKYPWITLKVILLIHWNAVLLYLKGLAYHAKKEAPEQQKDFLRAY
jgi:DUF1365 family protein